MLSLYCGGTHNFMSKKSSPRTTTWTTLYFNKRTDVTEDTNFQIGSLTTDKIYGPKSLAAQNCEALHIRNRNAIILATFNKTKYNSARLSIDIISIVA